MKVSYRETGSPGSWTVLFDETAVAAGPVLPEFAPTFADQVQQEAVMRAADSVRFPRGNTSVNLPLAFFVTYSTRALALAGVKTMRALKNLKLDFKVEEGTTVHYYRNGVLAQQQSTLMGVTVLHALGFITDDITTDEA